MKQTVGCHKYTSCRNLYRVPLLSGTSLGVIWHCYLRYRQESFDQLPHSTGQKPLFAHQYTVHWIVRVARTESDTPQDTFFLRHCKIFASCFSCCSGLDLHCICYKAPRVVGCSMSRRRSLGSLGILRSLRRSVPRQISCYRARGKVLLRQRKSPKLPNRDWRRRIDRTFRNSKTRNVRSLYLYTSHSEVQTSF